MKTESGSLMVGFGPLAMWLGWFLWPQTWILMLACFSSGMTITVFLVALKMETRGYGWGEWPVKRDMIYDAKPRTQK